jgi:hypothetical protein
MVADPFGGISNAWGALMVSGIAPNLCKRGILMSVIHFHGATTSTPEQFIAGLTDFGPGRSKVFKNSADAYLTVHYQGRRQADVTEGSGGIWERLLYDWSDPSYVKLTTIDSNVFGGASGYTYTLTRRPDGTTDIDVVIVREGKNFKGRVLSGVLGTIGKRSLGEAFSNSVTAIEARSAAKAAGESAAAS